MHRNHLFRLTALLALTLSACVPFATAGAPTLPKPPSAAPVATQTPNASNVPAVTGTASQKPRALVPEFQYILTVVFENREFGTVVNNRQMPYFNELARSHTLLTQHYAVTHPSLPNYLALLSGQTFGLTSDCTTCVYDAPSLPDLIEGSGRTWKAYEEDMPSSCFLGAETANYAMKHDPFVYFKAIRTDVTRCKRSVVPMGQLYADLANGNLPNYSFITPNICNDAHHCGLGIADDWLKGLMLTLLPALDAQAKPYLVLITWDEG